MKMLAALALLALSTPALASPYGAAYDAAFRATLAAPGDIDALLRYAEVAVEVGDFEGAIGALERLLMAGGDAPAVQVELSGLYLRIGSYAQARLYARSALKTDGVDPRTRDRAAALLALVDQQSSRHRLEGAVSLAAGYQTNASLAPSSSSVTVAGVTYDLAEDEQAQPDGNAFAAAAVRYVYDPGPTRATTLDATLAGSYAKQLEQTDLDGGHGGLAVGPRFRLGGIETGASVWVYGQANASLLAAEPYTLGFGGGATLTAPITGGLWTDVIVEAGQQRYFDSDGAPDVSERSGFVARGALQLRYRVFEHLWLVAGGHGFRAGAEVEHEANAGFGGVGGLSIPFVSPLTAAVRPGSVDLVYGLTATRYGAADPDVDPDTIRTGTEHRVSLYGQLPVSAELSTFVNGSFVQHDTNIAFYAYHGISASAGLTYRF